MAALTYVTNPLTADWAELASGKDNVILSLAAGSTSHAQFAVADALVDLGAIEAGHAVRVNTPPVRLENLGTAKVFGRSADGASMVVTAYDSPA